MQPDRSTWRVFALSAGLLAFEIALMRVLLYASWHHFAFLVISAVLLGFGASGTLLCFVRRSAIAHAPQAGWWLLLAAALLMPLCLHAAERVPIEARFVPTLLPRQIASWVLFWAILSVPFFVGSTSIAVAIMTAGERIPRVYAANLLGSAVGVVLITAAMHVVPPVGLGAAAGSISLLGIVPVPSSITRRVLACGIVAIIATAAWYIRVPGTIRVDPFKYQHYVSELVQTGRATHVATMTSSRAIVSAYKSPAFHDLPFLGMGPSPPPMSTVVVDGHWAGSVLAVSVPEQAEVVDHTLMSFPYALVDRRDDSSAKAPRVLLLGETGGANVWLALRHGAPAVAVVQPNQAIVKMLAGPLRTAGGLVFARDGVTVYTTEPRHFVEHSSDEFDVIQLSGWETWTAETGGVGGLNEDHLLTVEGLTAVLRRLTPRGVMAIGRGLQLPPRDNPKILATAVAALRTLGADEPADHVVIVRDFLAACTLVRRSPWTPRDIDRVRAECAARRLTPVYYAGIRADELNTPDALPGPPGGDGDWLYHASVELLSSRSPSFIADWPFDIRPATDARPFFGNFGRLSKLGAFRSAFGELWPTRAELALLFVLAATAIVAVAAFGLTILPLLFVRGVRESSNKSKTAVYFGSIGLAYLMIEMSLLSKLTLWIGDPVVTGSLVIGSMLLFSGVGSWWSRRIEPSTRAARRCLGGVVIAGAGVAWLVHVLAIPAGGLPMALRAASGVLLLAPLAFLMGFPMPLGLSRLEAATPAALPWAWGLNGFASVLAPPLATAVAMTWGFGWASAAALLFYAVAAIAYATLPRPEPRVKEDSR